MKKNLLLLILPMLLFTATLQAQIKYWDFGAKELGAGYSNMLPANYMNAVSARTRQLDWATAGDVVVTVYADGVKYLPKAGFLQENGESRESIYNATFNGAYAPGTGEFQLNVFGRDDGNGGLYLSGGSAYTKPTLFPDLDGTTNMSFLKDSNSDRLYTVNNMLTRYDERTAMPDAVDPNTFPGCLQFTTPGDKRYNANRGRGLGMDLQANQYVTVVGSGQYVDIEGDCPTCSLGCSTGWFTFETVGGTGTPIVQENKGAGTGASDCSGLSGGDRGDEAVRVMEFQAGPAQTYRLVHRGGTIRIYRVYVSNISIKSNIEALLGIDDVASAITTDVKSVGNRIYISNVKTKTEVNIYSITGALVKSIKTNEDTNFEFRSGLWIATVKTFEGQKSVKLLTK